VALAAAAFAGICTQKIFFALFFALGAVGRCLPMPSIDTLSI
jgi:hypothetical protein